MYVTDASLIDQAIFIQFFIVTKMVNEYRIFFNISIKHNKYVEHPVCVVCIQSHMWRVCNRPSIALVFLVFILGKSVRAELKCFFLLVECLCVPYHLAVVYLTIFYLKSHIILSMVLCSTK